MAHGGHRPNSGRKSKAELLLDAKAHAQAVAGFFTLDVQESTWRELLESDDEQVKLKAVMYLTDKMYGKAHQSMALTGADGGPIQSEHRILFVEREK
jgi:hypothetical protein